MRVARNLRLACEISVIAETIITAIAVAIKLATTVIGSGLQEWHCARGTADVSCSRCNVSDGVSSRGDISLRRRLGRFAIGICKQALDASIDRIDHKVVELVRHCVCASD